jgi:hypothetical protein
VPRPSSQISFNVTGAGSTWYTAPAPINVLSPPNVQFTMSTASFTLDTSAPNAHASWSNGVAVLTGGTNSYLDPLNASDNANAPASQQLMPLVYGGVPQLARSCCGWYEQPEYFSFSVGAWIYPAAWAAYSDSSQQHPILSCSASTATLNNPNSLSAHAQHTRPAACSCLRLRPPCSPGQAAHMAWVMRV